jgi:tetratricopeptide (TPR) repeat protein
MEERARLFLQESFELMTKTQMSSEQVYRFWQMNVDEIDLLLSAMPTLAAQIIEKDREERESLAHIFGLFGRLIQRFPHGNRRVNLELAIINYQICVDSFSQEREPSQWASYKYNLGLAYFERVAGDREVNIELGIRAYQDALKVITYQNFPVEWARTQYILGVAHSQRIMGERKRNLELAIDAFRAALEIYSCSGFLCTEAIDVDLAAYYTLKGFPCPGFPLEYRMIQDDLEIACYDILEPDLDLLQFEDLSLNRLTYEVYRGQRAIELTPEEFNLIKYLMCNPQQILSRDLIIRNVWDCDFSEELNIVEVHVRYLRRKLEQEGDRRLLYTVRGFGYTLGVHGHCGITGRE